MTTLFLLFHQVAPEVVEAYRLDRYDNSVWKNIPLDWNVVEAYRLDRYDNFSCFFYFKK